MIGHDVLLYVPPTKLGGSSFCHCMRLDDRVDSSFSFPCSTGKPFATEIVDNMTATRLTVTTRTVRRETMVILITSVRDAILVYLCTCLHLTEQFRWSAPCVNVTGGISKKVISTEQGVSIFMGNYRHYCTIFFPERCQILCGVVLINLSYTYLTVKSWLWLFGYLTSLNLPKMAIVRLVRSAGSFIIRTRTIILIYLIPIPIPLGLWFPDELLNSDRLLLLLE